MVWSYAQIAAVSLLLILFTMNLPARSAAQAAPPGIRGELPEAPSVVNRATKQSKAKILSSSATMSGVEQPSVEQPPGSMGTWNARDESAPRAAARGVALSERFAGDQRAIWTSPFHLERGDAIWALPALAGTGAFVASDSWFSKQVPAGEIARSRSLSNYGTFSLVGAAGGMILLGKITDNDHAAETGFLASEAAVNATVVDFAIKSMFQRQRPYDGTGAGRFFAGGGSFPSEHAAVSWAIAGVVAHEYPGTVTKLVSYGLASAVTVARVTGREHFPSDVVVGGALGYFIARQIYQRRRDPEISEGAWDNLVERNSQKQEEDQDQDKVRNPRNMGSTPVQLDSWVYPLFERLAAMGYIHSAYLGIRPWTRMQCARFLEEAGDSLRYERGNGGEDSHAADHSSGSQAVKLFDALSSEFAEETRRLDGAANLGMTLDSIYERTTSIAGPPLSDGYHFAETLINDYGRPYGRGLNAISGVAGHADAGPLSFSFQGEYQHAPGVPAYSPAIQQAISQTDQVPLFANGNATINHLQVINSSVALTYHDLQFSFGKQAEWLGPGESGPFLASTNAPSIVMFQIANMVPYSAPLLGPAQSIFFVGQLTGQNFVFNPPNVLGPGFHPQPFIHGNKVSFKPTENLEFGMGLTAIFGGPGLPFTFGEFFRSYYSHKVSISQNPAKRFSAFDISYRVPGLRQWLTVYNDSMVGDEISPIGSTRPMLSPGLYLPQVPKIPNLELRFEGVKDPFTSEFLPGFVYYDRRYRSGYTNGGNLIGSWVGRDGFGAQAQATYWLSPHTKLQGGYRYQEADRSFLAGGRLADYSLRAEAKLKSTLAVSAFLQYEQWMFPLLSASRQTNVTSSVQFTFYPQGRARP
jgi:membrane-associated phospholipid phosphatase